MEYTKDELKKSERFKHKRDLIEALFDEDETYEIEEVEEMTERFLKGSVR